MTVRTLNPSLFRVLPFLCLFTCEHVHRGGRREVTVQMINYSSLFSFYLSFFFSLYLSPLFRCENVVNVVIIGGVVIRQPRRGEEREDERETER